MMSLPVGRKLNHPRSLAPGRSRRVGSTDRIVGLLNDRRVQGFVPVAVVAAAILAYALVPPIRADVQHTWTILRSGDQQLIGDYLRSFGIWGPVISLGLMIAQAIVAPIPGALVVFANGIAFGTLWGTVLSVVGQTVAAIVSFLIARKVGRGPVEALVGRYGLESLDRSFGRWGPASILVLRLIPGMAFDGVSYGAGLLNIRFRTFVVATLLGIIPQSLFYTWMIRNYPDVMWTFTIVALIAFVTISAGAAVFGLLRRRRIAGSTTG